MITSAQIDLVRSSWTALLPKAVKFADLLYEELFGAEPHLRILFEGTMDEQHKKLASIISQAVDHLDDQAGLKRELHALGVRHKSYGVKPYHFDALGQAWLAALGRMLGADFTPEVREAWTAFYALLKEGMLEGIQPVPAPQH